MVRRRKWIILQATILVPLAAVLFSLQQTPVYSASADVLLSQQNLAQTLAGAPNQSGGSSPDRVASTQAELARVPEIARRVTRQLHLAWSTGEFLGHTSVSTTANADILTFSARGADADLAVRMAAAYAEAYTKYRRQLDTASIESARRGLEQRIAELKNESKSSASLYASLVEKEQQLKTMEALQTANASVVDTPTAAAQVSPRPGRNGALGLVLGLILGTGLAFLREALDTRVRSAEEIGQELGLPLLARIPEPARELRDEHRLVMLAEPGGAQAEAFRMLRTNLEFACVDRNVRTLMVTSAVEQEGKTTTAANLAVALARAGQRVLLVDLDLRRPAVDRFFDLRGRPGLTQVVLRRAQLEDAVVRVPFSQGQAGRLFVLGSGPIPPDPGEFVATPTLSEVLDDVRERVDLVIVDAPPLLHVGDALVLSAKADALVLVTKLETVRRTMLAEVRRLLEPMPTLKLGFVVTGAQREDGYGHGYGAYTSYHAQPAAPVEEPVA